MICQTIKEHDIAKLIRQLPEEHQAALLSGAFGVGSAIVPEIAHDIMTEIIDMINALPSLNKEKIKTLLAR